MESLGKVGSFKVGREFREIKEGKALREFKENREFKEHLFNH